MAHPRNLHVRNPICRVPSQVDLGEFKRWWQRENTIELAEAQQAEGQMALLAHQFTVAEEAFSSALASMEDAAHGDEDDELAELLSAGLEKTETCRHNLDTALAAWELAHEADVAASTAAFVRDVAHGQATTSAFPVFNQIQHQIEDALELHLPDAQQRRQQKAKATVGADDDSADKPMLSGSAAAVGSVVTIENRCHLQVSGEETVQRTAVALFRYQPSALDPSHAHDLRFQKGDTIEVSAARHPLLHVAQLRQ